MEPLSAYEKETIILFNNAEKTASVYAHDQRIIRKLREALEKYPDQARIEREDGESITVEIPKSWVTINLPREYTKEGREKMEKRMAKMREKLKEKRESEK